MTDKVFFAKEGEKGLTATSANHLANIAKELIKEDEDFLKELSFLNVKLDLLIGGREKISKVGIKNSDVGFIQSKIKRIGEFSAFMAWVREAIKAKEKATNEVIGLSIEEYAKTANISLPESPKPAKTFDQDYVLLNMFSLKELSEYYYLEAKAAKLGIAIHPSGGFAIARDNLIKRSNNPVTSLGSGSDTLITTYEPSVSLLTVNSTFVGLQNEHRETNARLNQIKYKIEQIIQQKNLEERQRFSSELNEHFKEMKLIENDFQSYKAEELKKVQNLKIVIPAELKEVFEFLNNIGK